MSARLAIFANLGLLGFLGACGWLEASHPSAYYASVQEDQALEWASFWSFLLAGLVMAWAARRQRRGSGALPWFLVALSLFCIFVAMEEVSWGQRIFGQQPPEFFLRENFQQELNLHNIASTGLRLFLLRGIVLGYGVLLPLLGLVPWWQRLFERTGVLTPPVALTPSMLALFWLHLSYPWKFTGEIVECGLGFCFLFVALAHSSQFSRNRVRASLGVGTSLVVLVVALAFTTAWWSQNRQSDDPAKLESAKAETEALRHDLVEAAAALGRSTISNCGLHKRVYAFVQDKTRAHTLMTGAYADLVTDGLPEARAEFFLDPWSSPYWIRDRCDEDEDRRVVFVYSFGPNRSRDSSRWELLGDDIGQYVLVEP